MELHEFSNTLQRYFMHGDIYAEAIANAEEVLEFLIEDYEASGKTLPLPQVLQLA